MPAHGGSALFRFRGDLLQLPDSGREFFQRFAGRIREVDAEIAMMPTRAALLKRILILRAAGEARPDSGGGLELRHGCGLFG